MPHIVLIALAGAGAIAGYRWISRLIEAEAATADEKAAPAEAPVGAMRDLGPLVWDEASGSYRPVRPARRQ